MTSDILVVMVCLIVSRKSFLLVALQRLLDTGSTYYFCGHISRLFHEAAEEQTIEMLISCRYCRLWSS